MESKESVPQLPSATDEPEPISGISYEKEALKLHLTIITEDPGIVNRNAWPQQYLRNYRISSSFDTNSIKQK